MSPEDQRIAIAEANKVIFLSRGGDCSPERAASSHVGSQSNAPRRQEPLPLGTPSPGFEKPAADEEDSVPF